MNRPCTLTFLVGCGCAVGSAWAEPVLRASPPAAEQWQYHEKWDKAKQRAAPSPKGVQPGHGCSPEGPPQGAVRAVPPAGRCPDVTLRVRT